MVTAKKTPAKKTPVKKARGEVKLHQGEEFRMPTEVKDWIDQASSRMSHMRSEIDRLKEENLKLRRANKVMEQRVMNMSVE
jgi:hypothetical protein